VKCCLQLYVCVVCVLFVKCSLQFHVCVFCVRFVKCCLQLYVCVVCVLFVKCALQFQVCVFFAYYLWNAAYNYTFALFAYSLWIITYLVTCWIKKVVYMAILNVISHFFLALWMLKKQMSHNIVSGHVYTILKKIRIVFYFFIVNMDTRLSQW